MIRETRRPPGAGDIGSKVLPSAGRNSFQRHLGIPRTEREFLKTVRLAGVGVHLAGVSRTRGAQVSPIFPAQPTEESAVYRDGPPLKKV